MRLGLSSLWVKGDVLPRVVQRAEDLGFESVWVSEHLVFPADMGSSVYPGSFNAVHARSTVPVRRPAPTTPLVDAALYLAYLAGQTSRIRLGTYIYQLALRHPFIVARAFQTLDCLSGGRVELGVGAGW